MQSTAALDLAAALDARLTALWRATGRPGHHDLSRTAASVLATLRDEGPRRVTELAASESVAQPSMTTLVNRLERLGLVERGPDPGDARAVLVSLTPAGRDRLHELREARAARLHERLAGLEDAELAALDAAMPALDSLIAKGPASP
jgi:DNA-binding MarR family transcriptional regulator